MMGELCLNLPGRDECVFRGEILALSVFCRWREKWSGCSVVAFFHWEGSGCLQSCYQLQTSRIMSPRQHI